MEKIAWLLIYLSAFGISEYILSKYFNDKQIMFYLALGFVGIIFLRIEQKLNKN
jgi:hypothetical protein